MMCWKMYNFSGQSQKDSVMSQFKYQEMQSAPKISVYYDWSVTGIPRDNMRFHWSAAEI